MLKNIEKEDLAVFPNLELLTLTSNQLQVIPGDLFEGIPRLADLSFKSNKITHVGQNLLSNLPRLRSADFTGNYCINQRAFLATQIPDIIAALNEKCPEPEA
jgi:Leucine-rich repeat (LRR) protein